MGLFQMRQQPVDEGPERPSHFQEDQNVRVPEDAGAVDYATETSDVEPVMGFEHPQDAIPVYLTESPPTDRPIRKWAANTVTATNQPISLVNDDRRRTRLVVANLDAANTVYLGIDMNNSVGGSVRKLLAGKELEMLHNSEVFVFTSGVLTAEVTYHWEWEMST